MAKVNLIEYTGKGHADPLHAARLLVFTKQTRLTMSPDAYEQMEQMSEETLKRELEYMATTIPSSWEFVDLTFLISDVTRACAQQITRTRTASYAMQSQRVTDLSGAAVLNPYHDSDNENGAYWAFEEIVKRTLDGYRSLVTKFESKREDARGILPMNIHCNLVAKYNLRAFVDLITARRSLRVQGEYSDIADQMYKAVIDVWPWAEPFFESRHEVAIKKLETVAEEIGITTGSGPGWEIAKAIDLLRKG